LAKKTTQNNSYSRGERQTIEALIIGEELLFAKCLRNEKKARLPMTAFEENYKKIYLLAH
jgi:hypothetical protein